jgi:hypothetical protein
VPVTPAAAGSINRRITIQANSGKRQEDPILKITRAERAGGTAQVVQNLPSKFKALSSKHSPPNTNKIDENQNGKMRPAETISEVRGGG